METKQEHRYTGLMIAHLKGLLVSTGLDSAVIDVGGVGYLVGMSSRSLSALGSVGGAVTVHTEMLVGEEFIRLVGFASEAERDWFRLLTGVQGVGARVALAILSALEPSDLHRAIAAQDKAMVARANGVGPKLAERIVRELKDKVGAIATGSFAIGLDASGAAIPAATGVQADALSALASLGFKPGEASIAVSAALDELGESASLDALVRLALRKAAK
ncbi:Holliday junction DNA helicase RuvA [Sphingobium sp. B7D2B]|nr:Holliday junction DNA helicase RuvA [Sphingobium sp. B7D2B]